MCRALAGMGDRGWGIGVVDEGGDGANGFKMGPTMRAWSMIYSTVLDKALGWIFEEVKTRSEITH